MREGPNLIKLARKEQCMALLSQLRTGFKLDGCVYRVFPSGEVQYLHPKDGVYPEKVNKGRTGANNVMRSIGKNPEPATVCALAGSLRALCRAVASPGSQTRRALLTDQVQRQAWPLRGVSAPAAALRHLLWPAALPPWNWHTGVCDKRSARIAAHGSAARARLSAPALASVAAARCHVIGGKTLEAALSPALPASPCDCSATRSVFHVTEGAACGCAQPSGLRRLREATGPHN